MDKKMGNPDSDAVSTEQLLDLMGQVVGAATFSTYLYPILTPHWLLPLTLLDLDPPYYVTLTNKLDNAPDGHASRSCQPVCDT